jgi:alkanesulfonate monooxygenase SsuD/methylene tetrahydromethanopterin reductase-like flavin-dependent oxidoreductase (luciferase family)
VSPAGAPLAAGSISLRIYPHALAPVQIVEELCRQAALADAAGFDGVMTSEHHGGFPGYLPSPLQAAGFLLEGMPRAWAAPAPLLLPLRHWSHVAEELAWLACRFPGRVGAGFASGGLARDFELAELAYAERFERFRAALPRVVAALHGRAEPPLADDPALAACAAQPIPLVAAAQSPAAVRRAARLGIGVLFDSLQTAERTRELSDAHREAGGRGPCIAIRRVWLGVAPEASVERQMSFYRGYAAPEAQRHWGEGHELVSGADGAELALRLADFAVRAGCDALNLRVHLSGLEPARVREQIERLGAETLPALRPQLATPGAR